MEKRKKLISLWMLIVLIVLIIVVMLNYNFIIKTITGKATTQPTNVTVTVSGTNPAKIHFVSPIAAVDLEGGTSKTIYFNITVTDNDGVADLNDSSFTTNFSKSNEAIRYGTCTLLSDINTTSANYSCSINIWYWDGNGAWNVAVRGTDLGNLSWALNTTTTFTVNALYSLVISPLSLTWPAVSPGATNQTSNNDPTLVNNTGNVNSTVRITGINLLGQDDSSYVIYTANFTVGVTNGTAGLSECNSTNNKLANNSAVIVNGSFANRGNLSLGSGAGQEEVYYCIPRVPSNLSSQPYSTLIGGSWVIDYS